MGLLTLFCVITVAFTGLTSGAVLLPDSVAAAVGGSVTFTTSLAPAQTPLHTISWNYGSKNILTAVEGVIVTSEPEYRDRISLNNSTGSLELRNLALTDAGDYRVSIRPMEDDAATFGTTTLSVYEPVSDVRVTINNTDLVEFSSVSLSCSASGSSLSFLWFKDSVEVTASDRVHFSDGGANVTIVTVWRSDHGSYSCKVSNSVSINTSVEVPVFVSYGPEDVILTITPSAEYYEEGSVVSLSCSADSRPDAQFNYFISGEMLPSKPNLVLEQSGSYSCQAFNNKTLRYNSSQPIDISLFKNISDISVNTSHRQPVEGSSVNLTCEASGSIFFINWTINGLELTPSENIVFYEDKRVLSFRFLTRKDNGTYTCTISNPISSQSVDYTMNVNYGPDSVQILDPGKVQVGTTLKLLCLAESVPTAHYTWTHNGTTVGESQEYTKDKTEYSDSGEYVCRATNDVTMKSSEASHTVLVTDFKNVCSTGCIVGIVFGCIGVILLVSVAVFCALKKKKQKSKSNTRTDGEGRDNSAYAQNQEVQYADVQFVKKDGGVVQLGAQNNNTEYSEVRRNHNAPGARLPTYNAHMQRVRRDAPEPETEYAQVRPK